MRRVMTSGLGVLLAGALFASPAFAGKMNAADFPLRVHIVFRNGNRHYHGMGGGASTLDGVDGLGQGNLFENGQPLGFDFTYQCSQPITPQSVYETFMARWKKLGRVIEIIMPVIGGKPGEVNACDLNVTMKQDTIYLYRSGALVEEPAATFREWMAAHDYDPEQGKNAPADAAAKPAGGPAPAN